ncbi:MAG TPA: hypothetical protein VLK24_08560 [Gaiellaceae bacterium]|nr:hypothetical protein [Gaiellaceae bacterium]
MEREPVAERDWPPNELLALHDRYDVSNVDLEGGGFLGRLVAPLRVRLLRPLVEFASRQTEVNALTAQTLSELANRTEELHASEADRRRQDDAIQALRRRLAALESAPEGSHDPHVLDPEG